ncbi:MAG TPA: tetratricopeptide repeat protein [Lacunisphaera sp.]
MPRAVNPRQFPWTALAVATIPVTGFAAYWNSLTVPFLFDDVPTIAENPALQTFSSAFSPASYLTTGGRPVLNLTFWFNRAIRHQSVWSYHATNILIHVAAALLLFALICRTLRQPTLLNRFGSIAEPLALTTAALWMLHPLQTESVTYIVQRAESLVGLFYLFTVYLFVRGTASTARNSLWYVAATITCLLGMATKEVMVSAPLIVFLYDRTFIAGSFRDAWRRRWKPYCALMLTWLPLTWLVVQTHGRGGSAGFSSGISAWHYILTQGEAIVLYLKLIVWPYPLVFDYGTDLVTKFAQVWWQSLLLVALAGGTVWSLIRRPALGFLGVWFFAILAPSSSFIPVATQSMAEHRIYLSLAAPVLLLVVSLYRWLNRTGLWFGAAIAVLFGARTIARNADYHTALSIWSDVVTHRPENSRAQLNLGVELLHTGRTEEAKKHFIRATELNPDYALAHYHLGLAWQNEAHLPEALAEYETAARLAPANPDIQVNLANLLARSGRTGEALPHYQAALQLTPAADIHFNLAQALGSLGRTDEAAVHFETALRLAPGQSEWRSFIALWYARRQQWTEAATHFKILVQQKPNDPDAHANYGNVLLFSQQPADAVREYETALRLRPGDARTEENLQLARQSLP